MLPGRRPLHAYNQMSGRLLTANTSTSLPLIE
jgi:hypothetical protein